MAAAVAYVHSAQYVVLCDSLCKVPKRVSGAGPGRGGARGLGARGPSDGPSLRRPAWCTPSSRPTPCWTTCSKCGRGAGPGAPRLRQPGRVGGGSAPAFGPERGAPGVRPPLGSAAPAAALRIWSRGQAGASQASCPLPPRAPRPAPPRGALGSGAASPEGAGVCQSETPFLPHWLGRKVCTCSCLDTGQIQLMIRLYSPMGRASRY